MWFGFIMWAEILHEEAKEMFVQIIKIVHKKANFSDFGQNLRSIFDS